MSLVTILLVAAVKGSVLLVAAWLATRALPRMSAASRHLLWTSALGGLVLMPLLVSIVPTFQSRFVPPIPVVTSIQTNEIALVGSRSPASRRATTNPPSSTVDGGSDPSDLGTAARDRSIDLRRWFPVVWAVVAMLLLFRLVFGRLRLSLIARRASVVDDGQWLLLVQRLAHRLEISRPITLLRSSRSCVPMTWGLVYPIVLLPAGSDEWPMERRTIVLLHELAHVNRLDAVTQFIAQVATAVFWFNPIVWLAARAMRVERELACDDCVIAGGARPSDYAQDLLQIARSFSRTPDVAVAALAMARRGDLEERMMAILDPAANRGAVSRGRMFAGAAGIVFLSVPLAALAPPPVQAASISTAVEATSVAVLTSRLPDSIVAPPVRAANVSAVPRAERRSAPDRETLLSVARAAARINSSYDKAELLVPIAKYYAADAELARVYLTAAASISSDYDCARTFTAFLTSNPATDEAIELAMGTVATKFTSDYEKANLILAAIGGRRSIGPEARTAIIRAIGTIKADFEKHRAMTPLVKRGEFNDRDATDLIGVAASLKGGYDKAGALIEIADNYQDLRGPARQAYVTAAESITSGSDYRRAMEALLKRP